MILNIFLELIDVYDKGDLERFDAIVGENACQIRAVKIILIKIKNSVNFIDKKRQIQNTLLNITYLLSDKKINSLMQSKISLKDVINNENLNIFLSNDEMFLLNSFLLTEAKNSISSEELFFMQLSLFSNKDNDCNVVLKKETVCPEKLKKYGLSSKRFLELLTRRARKLLSKSSVEFVKEIALYFGDNSLSSMFSDRFVTRHLNCDCIPMFWTYKALFLALQKEGIPIVVHAKFLKKDPLGFKVVDEEYLLFEKSDNDLIHTYKPIDNTCNFKNNAPVFTIQGIVYQNSNEKFCKHNWKDTFLSIPLKKVVLSGAAHHRQYPNPELDEMIVVLNDKEYEQHKIFAEEIGGAISNTSTFFIQHVYSSTFDKYTN